MNDYVVAKQGESVESIATLHGHFWQTLWEHPNNAELRGKRATPHALLPGDRVFVPELRANGYSKPDQQRHVFRRKGIPSRLHLIMKDCHGIRADEDYIMDIDGVVSTGKTGPDGAIIKDVPPLAIMARVRLCKDLTGTVHRFMLRSIDPIDTITGIQGRLMNLGYPIAEVDGIDGPVFQDAIRAFQRNGKNQGLKESGKIDDATRAAIRKAYGH